MAKPRDFVLTFTGAGEQEVLATGRYLRVLESQTAGAYFSLDGGSELLRAAGQEIADSDPAGFTRVRVRSLIAQTVRFVVSDVPQDDSRSNVALAVSATVQAANQNLHLPVVTVAAGGSALLAAADANRKSLRVALDSNQPGPVYLGGAGIGAGAGGIIEPGMVDYIDTEGELWAYNPGGQPVNVTVLALRRP